jgi:putative ABC transport system substrate-binding protein
MLDQGRRRFIAALGGTAAWPLLARAQQPAKVARIGMLLGSTTTDRPDLAAFLQALQQLGWTDGRNVRIEYRSGLGNAADTRKQAEELVARW